MREPDERTSEGQNDASEALGASVEGGEDVPRDDGEGLPPEPEAPSATLMAVPVDALPLDFPREVPPALQGKLEKPLSSSTRRAYARAWRDWITWCDARGRRRFPAHELDLAEYIDEQAGEGLALASLELTYQAIRATHRAFGEPLPAMTKVRNLFGHISRQRAREGVREGRGKAPLQQQWLIEAPLPQTLRDLRNRAILFLGFGLGSRRSELANMKVRDVTFRDEGAVVHIPVSKTDQEGKDPRDLGLRFGEEPHTCPVRALQAWLKYAHLDEGPLFVAMHDVDRLPEERTAVSKQSVAVMVKALVRHAGQDEERYSAHSLRSGFVTHSRAIGIPDDVIMYYTGHKSLAMMKRYDRNDDPMRFAPKLF